MRKLSTKSFRTYCIVLSFLLVVSQVVFSQIIIRDTVVIQERNRTLTPKLWIPPPPPEDTTTHSELLLVDSTTYEWKSIKPNFNPDSFQVKIDWNISVANFYDSPDPWSFDLSDSPRGIFSRRYQTVLLPYSGTSTLSGSAIVASNYSRYAFQVGFGGFPVDVRVNTIGDTAVFIFTTNASANIRINGTLVLSLLSAKKQLTIVTHQPWTIWPSLPPSSAKGVSGYNHKRTFSIQVLDASGQPVAHEGIKIKTDFIPFSGGHDHNHPALERGKQGVFYGQTKHNNPLELSTDEFGIAIVDSFISSKVSGSYLITAFLAADTTIKDTVNLVVNVPDLIPLPSGSGNLITFTSTEDFHALTNSDYGTQVVLNAVTKSVAQYAQEYGMPSDIFLAVVDMSLPFGGLFDINGDWHTPHSLHRVGKSVDFSKYYRDASGKVISVDIYRDGTLRETTNTIDQEELDRRFAILQFKRLEAPEKIHYESLK